MSDNKRVLRSALKRSASTNQATVISPPAATVVPPAPDPGPISFRSADALQKILILPYGSELPGLDKAQLSLLRRKQRQLKGNAQSIKTSLPAGDHHRIALNATLIFSHNEAGTALCINPNGWILTCSHCFGESEEEWQTNKFKWLLFYTGLAIQVKCCVWDSRTDLALAKVITVEYEEEMIGRNSVFSYVPLAAEPPSRGTQIVCIGQPGRDDLESTTSRKTRYNLLEVSEGHFRGMVSGVDPCDNSAIGTLKHDAWTYWGHSGAPLLRKDDGALIGLHSSWDDKTSMRHGIPLVTIRNFLERHLSYASALTKDMLAHENLEQG